MGTLAKILAATAGLLCMTAAPALAQDWPQKTVRFIVPFPPGGGTDVVARMVAKNLQDKLGQTIIVENRGGANGAIGLMAVKQGLHDGYTFAFTSDTPMTVNPWLYKDLSYEPLKDFLPVTNGFFGAQIVILNKDVPVTTLAELVAYSKQHPDKLNFASMGLGGDTHLIMEWLKHATGAQITHVPYKGFP